MSGNSSLNLLKKSAIGAGIGIIITSAAVLLFAAVLSIGNIPAMMIEPFSVAAVILGAFCGGFIAAKFFGEKGLFCGLISGAIFFLILWVFGGILGEGGVFVQAIIKAATVLFSSAIGGILGVNSYKIK